MINDITKTIILIMTVIVTIIMAYLVHSPKFIHLLKGETLPAGKAQKYALARTTQVENSGGPSIASSKTLVKIGINLPLSGEKASFGNGIKTALEMSYSELYSDTKFNYEIVFHDTGKNTSFTDISDSDALLSTFDDAETTANIADERKTPHITCSYGNKVVTEHKYTINSLPPSDVQAKAFLKNLENNGLKIFSIVAANNPQILELVDAVKMEAKKNNFPLLSVSIIDKGTKDFAECVKILNTKNPEAVMLMLEPEELNILVSNLNESGSKFIYTSIDMLQNIHNKNLVNGAVFIIFSNGDYQFQEDFRKKSILHIPPCAVNMYDSLKILVSIYESGEENIKLEGEDVLSSLKKISKFPSASGVDLKVYKKGFMNTPMVGVEFDNSVLKFQ